VHTLKLFSKTFDSLEKGLNYSSLKQEVISQNIANVDTPNYKAKEVRFKDVLNQSMIQSKEAYRTDPRHFHFNVASSSTNIVDQKNVTYNNNGNSVDMDKEMSDLATNQIYFDAMTEQLNLKFNSLKDVIKGGR
jgi:flagellar basal-body rod protein FlgB